MATYQQFSWPVVNASNPSIGGTGVAAPANATEVAGVDGGGVLRALSTDTSGNLNVNVSSSVLPPGAATAANQVTQIGQLTTINTSLGTINTTLGSPFQAGGSIGNASFGATQVGTWNINNISGTISLPTGASTSALQTTGNSTLSTISGQLPTVLGQHLSAASLSVVIASDQSAVPVSGSVTVSGTVAATQSGTWNINNISGTISLPTGAATAANQSTIITTLGSPFQAGGSIGNTTFASTQSGTWTVQPGNTANTTPWLMTISQGGNSATVTASNALKVDGSAVTQPVSGTVSISGTVAVTQSTSPWVDNISQFGGSNVVTGTGASGAGIPRVTISNDSSLAANQSVNMNQVGGSSVTLGSKVSASSIPVVIASDQGSYTVAATQSGTWSTRTQDGSGNSLTSHLINSERGLDVYNIGFSQANAPVYNDYTSTNVTTSAYVQLVASTTSTTSEIEIYDTSGQLLYLATGGAGSEVNQLIIPQGGNSRIKFSIASGTRVSVKAITATANQGSLAINFYG